MEADRRGYRHDVVYQHLLGAWRYYPRLCPVYGGKKQDEVAFRNSKEGCQGVFHDHCGYAYAGGFDGTLLPFNSSSHSLSNLRLAFNVSILFLAA